MMHREGLKRNSIARAYSPVFERHQGLLTVKRGRAGCLTTEPGGSAERPQHDPSNRLLARPRQPLTLPAVSNALRACASFTTFGRAASAPRV